MIVRRNIGLLDLLIKGRVYCDKILISSFRGSLKIEFEFEKYIVYIEFNIFLNEKF